MKRVVGVIAAALLMVSAPLAAPAAQAQSVIITSSAFDHLFETYYFGKPYTQADIDRCLAEVPKNGIGLGFIYGPCPRTPISELDVAIAQIFPGGSLAMSQSLFGDPFRP